MALHPKPDVECHHMADGSAILADPSTRSAHALNAEAAAVWKEGGPWTEVTLASRLEARSYPPRTARNLARAFLQSLRSLGVVIDDAGP